MPVMHRRLHSIIVYRRKLLLTVHIVHTVQTVCSTVSVYPNILSSSDSTRISGMIVLITWHTWFTDSFSPFILGKCSDSLQSVCFELSKRNQRHVSTRNKCYCKMSPAAHEMMNCNHMLISRSCSCLHGVPSRTLGCFIDMGSQTDRSRLPFVVLINSLNFFFLFFLSCLFSSAIGKTKNAFMD